MDRYTVSTVVLGLSTPLQWRQRCTGFGRSKEVVIKSTFKCEGDRELYDSLHCRRRCIRFKASWHCMGLTVGAIFGMSRATDLTVGSFFGMSRAMGLTVGAIFGMSRAINVTVGANVGMSRAVGFTVGAIFGMSRAVGLTVGAIFGMSQAMGLTVGVTL